MVHERNKASFDWLALWILYSAWSSFSGWCLSALGVLNAEAIMLSSAFFWGGVVLFRSGLQGPRGLSMRRILRSRRLAPKIWLTLTVLALMGGITHAPNNYDYLTYRFPRVLYWSWDHAWSWIPTINERINYSGTGFEWLMVPQFVVLNTDRFFFLINFVSYLFLPGLIFAVFSQLGISKRISWWWMWVFPTGYCYILQAASAGNDSFAATYLLASFYFLLEAKPSTAARNFMLSCLAIALVTGAKASNVPLGLPWLVLLFFQREKFLGNVRPAFVVMVLAIAAAVSFLPTAALNIRYTGDFAGDPLNKGHLKENNPVSGVLGNSFQMIKDNLAPPISPRDIDWTPLEPSFLKPGLLRDFPRMYLHTEELQIEEDAGAGLGVTLFACLFIFMGIRARLGQPEWIVTRKREALWVMGASLIAWLGYATKMSSEATSRLIAAYYPVLVACTLVIVSLDGRVVGRRVFRWVGLLAMLSALPLVVLCPARPLFPVDGVADLMKKAHVPTDIISRYHQVYTIYAARANAFQDFAGTFPADERTIGLIQEGNDSVVSLWRPFGSRKMVEVSPNDSSASIQDKGIRFVAVSDDGLALRYHTTIAAVVAKWSCTIVAQKDVTLLARRGPSPWYLLRL